MANTNDAIEGTTLKVYGFVSTQGTAMAGTAFCERHAIWKEQALEYAQGEPDADPAFEAVDVSQNELMFCGHCGLNGYSESDDFDEDI